MFYLLRFLHGEDLFRDAFLRRLSLRLELRTSANIAQRNTARMRRTRLRAMHLRCKVRNPYFRRRKAMHDIQPSEMVWFQRHEQLVPHVTTHPPEMFPFGVRLYFLFPGQTTFHNVASTMLRSRASPGIAEIMRSGFVRLRMRNLLR